MFREFAACYTHRAEQSGQGYRRGALHVVVEAANLVAITVKQTDRVDSGPILKLDTAVRELFLDGGDEFLDELV